jgi:ketose-bisphosphate aldolase
MPLIKIKTILNHAQENGYGVPAINTFNYETVAWAVKAAERENVPVIVQLYPGYDFFVPPKFIAHMAVTLAKEASVPVAVHLDHSTSYEIAVKGIKAGFPSVMVDGSALAYEDNVALTAAVARVCRVFDTDLEAELGRVGIGSRVEDMVNTDKFTDPEQAADFVARTGCDLLAVAVGNAHGPYVQTPALDFGRIKAIRKALTIPLVLHGCSDIPDDQIQETVRLGISKYNIATEYFRAYYNAITALAPGMTDAFGLVTKSEEAAVDFVRGKLRLLNPKGITLS